MIVRNNKKITKSNMMRLVLENKVDIDTILKRFTIEEIEQIILNYIKGE